MISRGTNCLNFSKEEDVAFVISAEGKLLPLFQDGSVPYTLMMSGRCFVQNVDKSLPDCVESHPVRQKS